MYNLNSIELKSKNELKGSSSIGVFDDKLIHSLNALSSDIKHQIKNSKSFIQSIKNSLDLYKDNFSNSLTLFSDLHEMLSINTNNLTPVTNAGRKNANTTVTAKINTSLVKIVKDKSRKFNEIIENCLNVMSAVAQNIISIEQLNYNFFESAKKHFKQIKGKC